MNQCLGGSINLQSIQYRIKFTIGDTVNFLRFVIFQWYPDNTADAPSWEKIFQYHTLTLPFNMKDYLSPYVLDRGSTQTFKVLHDEMCTFDTDDPTQIFKGFINKGFKKKLEEDATYGTNHIYMMFLSDSNISAHVTFDGFTRIRFTDA